MNTKFNNRFNSTSAIELPRLISKLGLKVNGLELGVWFGNNIGYLLDNCPNIEIMHGIDPYLPYEDWNGTITQEMVGAARLSALKILDNFKDRRWYLWEDTSANIAADASKYGLNKLDFIFIDGDHSFERCYEDLNLWYDNIRSGGLFSGHDYSLPGVNKALLKFRQERNITGFFKVIPNDVWYWIKD